MRPWTVADKIKRPNGEYTITYAARGCITFIEARRRLIPHANGEGGWLHTSYFLIRPDGSTKEYMRLRDAQRAVEEEENHA